MPFDINNQFTGSIYGQDRIGHTTPDLEVSDVVRPWLPNAYPAPYLPSLRQDQGHPKLANVVLSSQQLVGLDSSGGLVPAGLFCGSQAAIASGGQYCILVYGPSDVGFTWNPQTCTYVAAAGEHVVLAAPSDATAGNVTLPNGTVVAVSSGDITFAHACTLFDTGVARPIGVATRNVLQFIGTVIVKGTSPNLTYQLDAQTPTGFVVLNYMHEMGTAIQTQYVIRVPWIGATPYALTANATTDSVTGYVQGYGLSFAHFTGSPKKGECVVASSFVGDAGNYSDYDSTKNTPGDIIGRVIGVMNMIDRIGYSNRVRTLWDPGRLVGPVKDPNPASIMMGGSATGGIDYTLNLTTDGLYKKYLAQGKSTASRPELATYVIVRVNL